MKAINPVPFTHTPRAPELGSAGYEDQRYFLRNYLCESVGVMRFSEEERARISISFGSDERGASVYSYLDADQCRQLARALIDAAHDMEALPVVVEG